MKEKILMWIVDKYILADEQMVINFLTRLGVFEMKRVYESEIKHLTEQLELSTKALKETVAVKSTEVKTIVEAPAKKTKKYNKKKKAE